MNRRTERTNDFEERLLHRGKTGNSLEHPKSDEQDTREMLELAVRSAMIGLWDWDLVTNKVTYSREWKALLGYTEGEIRNDYSAWEELIHPDDLQGARATIDKFVKDPGAEYVNEFRLRHKDGSYRWILARGSMLLDENNKPRRMLGSHIDITQQKQDDERFKSAFDSLLEGAQIIDFDWRYRYLNPAVEKHSRRPNQELLGKKISEMWPGIESTLLYANMKRCIEERIPCVMENEFTFPDGKIGVYQLSIQPIPTGILILSTDISSRKQNEERVQQLTRMYATLSHINEAILRITEPKELFQAICDVAVEYGKFNLAWIGLVDEEGTVQPTAATNLEITHWPLTMINLNKTTTRNGIVARSLKSSRVVTSENIAQVDQNPYLAELISKFNIHSLACIPFKVKETIGVINLTSTESGFFTSDEEIALLNEIGNNLNYALAVMETEKVHKEMERLKQLWADAFANCAHGMAIGIPETNQILTCNPAFAKLHGRSVEEISSMPILSVYAPEDHEHVIQSIIEADRTGWVQYEASMIRKDGTRYPVQMDVVSVKDENGKILYRVATQQDITERKKADQYIQQINRLYATLSEVNQAIVRIKDEETLYETICRVAVEIGKFRAAWIGMVDDQTGDIALTASAGLNPELAEFFGSANYKNLPYKDGILGLAIQTGKVAYINEVESQTTLRVWNSLANDNLFQSAASIPIRRKGKIIALLNLFADDVHFFDLTRQHKLLEEMSGDISFALETFDNEKSRRQIENNLARNEQQLKLFVEYAPAAIAMFDREMKYLAASRRFLEDYGLGDREIIGHSHYEIFPEITERWKQIHQRCLAGAVEKCEEDPFPRLDGSLDWVKWEIHPWHESDGKIGGILLFSEVITERKEMYERLIESEANLSEAQRIAKIGSWKYIVETDIIHWSDELYRIFEITPGDFDGSYQSIFKWILPEDQTRVDEANRKALVEGLPFNITFHILTSLGKKKYLLETGSPSRDKDGKVYRVVGVVQDVTEQMEAQEALIASEEKFRSMVESTPDLVSIVDDQFQIKFVNRTPAGLPMEKILGAHAFDYIDPKVKTHAESIARQVLESGEPATMETLTQERNGVTRWYETRMALVKFSNGEKNLLVLSEDISERKQAEHETQRRNADLGIIKAINDAINEGEDIPGITEAFLREARQTFQCQDAAIYLFTQDGKFLEMQSTTITRKLSERIEQLIGAKLPKVQLRVKEGGFIDHLLEEEGGTITEDPQEIMKWITEFTETNYLSPFLQSAIKKIVPQIYKLINVKSVISMPLVAGGKTIGLMDLSSKNQFSDEDLVRIRSLSQQMTGVIQRKQAEEQAQTQLKRIVALSEIDRAITSSMDIRVSLDILLNEVLVQLNADAASVLLLNPDTQTLEYVAGKGFKTLAIRQSRLRIGEGLAGQAALERRTIHQPDLKDPGILFKRRELFKEEGFVEYIGVPLIAKGIVKGVIEIFNRIRGSIDQDWVNFLETMSRQAAIAIDNTQMFEGLQLSNTELVTAYDATIAGWSRAMDLRDKETEGHTQRVTEMAVMLAERLGISQKEITQIRRGALLHDIGKLGVPDNILLKPAKLTDEEWKIMRMHPVYAFDMLMPISYLRPAIDIPYAHHEKWDGSGYPRGLKGEQIPLAARLFSVVDVWDALRSDRPYRSGWPEEKVRQYLRDEMGKQFDPQIVETFLSIVDHMEI